MRKTIALSALAGWLIAWNWLRLETGTSFGQAVLIVTLAIAPAVFRSTPTRATAALVGFLIAAVTPRGRALHDYLSGTLVVFGRKKRL